MWAAVVVAWELGLGSVEALLKVDGCGGWGGRVGRGERVGRGSEIPRAYLTCCLALSGTRTILFEMRHAEHTRQR